MGIKRYLNLNQCKYYTGGAAADNYTTFIPTTDTNGAFNAGTNTSNVADTSATCGPGGSGYSAPTPNYRALDLLGKRYLNLNQCKYYSGAGSDNYTTVIPTTDSNGAFNAGTNTSNVADTSATCGSGISPYGLPTRDNRALNLLGNRYLNLNQCKYYSGAAGDNYTTVIPTTDSNGAFNAGTNTSNVAGTSATCGPGGFGYSAPTRDYRALDLLDTTRGAGFVQFEIVVPSPPVTTTYPESASLTGTGTGNPTSNGSVTVVVGGSSSVGDWGFPLGSASAVPPGHKLSPVVKLTCDPTPSVLPAPDLKPCTYAPGMMLRIRALNGSKFLQNTVMQSDTNGSQWDLNNTGNGSRVGWCHVSTETEITCAPGTLVPGTVNAGDGLVTSIPVDMLATSTPASPAFQYTWYNPYGEPQRGAGGDNDLYGANDYHTIVTKKA